MPPAAQPTVIVTGAASGIGLATARLLAARGYRVIGGDLRVDGAEVPPGATLLPLDVREQAQVDTLVARALEGAGRIDGLVNNAGFAIGGAVEETSIEEAREQLETNFFGAARLLRAVLPHMRAQGGGRLINVSSGAAVTAQPFAGFYTASKCALEGLSEALAHEVRAFGVRVSIVEPGFTRTNVARHGRLARGLLRAYDPWRNRAIRSVKAYGEVAQDPDAVARCVLRILRSRAPALRYRVGADVTSSFWTRRVLPYAWFAPFVRDYYRLDAAADA